MTVGRSEDLSRYLKEMRLKKGFTQVEIAQCLGYSSPQFVSNWERALAAPPIHILRELVRLYSLDPNTVIEMYVQPIRKKLERELRFTLRRKR
jgi:transcriptional regulator with XRE-family HTH domain